MFDWSNTHLGNTEIKLERPGEVEETRKLIQTTKLHNDTHEQKIKTHQGNKFN